MARLSVTIWALLLSSLLAIANAQAALSTGPSSPSATAAASPSPTTLSTVVSSSLSESPTTTYGNGGAVPSDSYDDGGAAAGASGADTGSFHLSKGGMIAIIVVVVLVGGGGIVMSTLYFIAKRRDWQMKERMRRMSQKIKTVVTPRLPKKMTLPTPGRSANGGTKARFDVTEIEKPAKNSPPRFEPPPTRPIGKKSTFGRK